MKKHKHYKEIIAWANGAEIEFKTKSHVDWFPASTPNWNIDSEYRVKPELEYVPFTFEDANQLVGSKVIPNNSTEVVLITKVTGWTVTIDGDNMNFEYLLKYFTFLDGTPCGKLNK